MTTVPTRRLLLALAVASMTAACASTGTLHSAPPPVPIFTTPTSALVDGQTVTPPADIEYGINDGGYTGVPRDAVDVYCSWGGPVSVRSPVRNGDEARIVLESERPCPNIRTHFLIEQNRLDIVDSVAAYAVTEPNVTRIECGNELELPPLELPIAPAAAFVGQCGQRLRDAGYTGRIVTAAIYTIDDDQLQRLAAYHAACPTCECGLHWYAGNPNEWKTKLAAIGCPRYVITEIGQPSRTATEDAGQDAYIRAETAWLWQLGVSLIEPYQRQSGPSQNNLDNFGWQRLSDGTWKPVALFWQLLVGGLKP